MFMILGEYRKNYC